VVVQGNVELAEIPCQLNRSQECLSAQLCAEQHTISKAHLVHNRTNNNALLSIQPDQLHSLAGSGCEFARRQPSSDQKLIGQSIRRRWEGMLR
jgi:hypothetical protein